VGSATTFATLTILEVQEIGETDEEPCADLEAAGGVHHAPSGAPVPQPIARHHLGHRQKV
jgi:hypothetical protein